MNYSTIEQSKNGKPFTVKPVDKFVELYNGLWLNIRDNKKKLTGWIKELFEKTDDLDERVSDLENQLDSLRNDIIIEIREEIIREVREEMRA